MTPSQQSKEYRFPSLKDGSTLFSLELRDTETPPTSPLRSKTRNSKNVENQTSIPIPNNSPAIPETTEEIEKRNQIKAKLKKDKEKREQDKIKIRKKKFV